MGNRVYLYCVRIVRCAVLEIQLSQYITMLALHSDLPTVQFITFMKKQCSHGHISDVQGKSIQNHKFFFLVASGCAVYKIEKSFIYCSGQGKCVCWEEMHYLKSGY